MLFRRLNLKLMSEFARQKTLLKLATELNKMDSLQLDKKCASTLKNYVLPLPKDTDSQSFEREILHQKFDHMQNSERSIKFLYEVLSSLNIGYLKGDIHSGLVYRMSKSLSEKDERILESQFSAEDGKTLFNEITEKRYFRIPKHGVEKTQYEDKNNFYQRQLILEIVSAEQSQQKFDNILDSLVKVGKVHLSETLRKYIVEWFTPLCQAIKDEQSKCRDSSLNRTFPRKIYAEYFVKLSAERLTSVCLSELMKEITTILYKDYDVIDSLGLEQEEKDLEFQQYDAIKYKKLCLSLAKWVNIQSVYEQEERKFKYVMKLYDRINQAKKISPLESQGDDALGEEDKKKQEQEQESKIQEHLNQIENQFQMRFVRPEDRKNYLLELGNKLMRSPQKYKAEEDEISEEAQYQMGATLIFMMKEILKTRNKSNYLVPLLTLEHKFIKREKQVLSEKMLKVHEHFLNKILPEIQKEGDLFMHLQRAIPTIIEPLPWVEYEIGGYYLQPCCVMRFSECKVQERLVKYSDMSRVYNILNSLGRIPWQINKKVLDIMEAIWQEGGEVGEVPKRYSELVSTYLMRLKMEKNPVKQKKIIKVIQKLRDQHSMRSDFNLKLNIARSFCRMERFYYPHNLDFRGRVYPVPPHLNHIGNDISRGLLCFAEGKQLGETGVKWLKIHCSNLMGKDKATVPEKLQFFEANRDLVKAMGEDPLKHRQWLSYQDPWQAIGAIMEVTAALKHPNPTEYVSHLHVHQDGSCNGLQHYAALGRDMQGAYQVNLGPTQRPGDVYTHVAKMVIKMVEADIANKQSPSHELAKKLEGNIKRKTIKQTVMTSVYGVTFIGAREQIHRQLKDQGCFSDDDEAYLGSIYLAKYTLEAISNLFQQAHHIKKWLISCAGLVSEQGNPVGWITPMGLPVVQPYRKQSSLDMVNTIIQKLRLPSKSENLPVNKSKQKSAFPPNYVHSLDSTHMMYTAEKCIKEGITFAAVHDSYWTHAADVDRMNVLLREEFIRLHSEPLLENLKASFEKRYPQVKFPQIPKRGQFNLEKIKESVYFFS